MSQKRRLRAGSSAHLEVHDIDDVSNARDRLKGVLQELLIQSDDSAQSSGDEDVKPDVSKLLSVIKKEKPEPPPLRQARKRRRRELINEDAFHHTYVMKLFDRSVDLAQFQEDTPLYPVCRAWMANQPRNKNLVPKMRTPTPEPLIRDDDLLDSEVRDMYKMPRPEPLLPGQKNLRVPSPIPIQETKFVNIFNNDNGNAPSRETLLNEHLSRWNKVRKKWLDAAFANEMRYAESGRILKAIYHKALKDYDP